MIVALAGRRIDVPTNYPPVFPVENIELVRGRIEELFKRIRIKVLVCSGACGADLLALDVAGSLGAKRKLVLPLNHQKFKSESVIDRPGPWGDLFDSICQELNKSNDIIYLEYTEDYTQVFERTNEAILDLAEDLSKKSIETKDDALIQNAMAVLVWNGQPKKSKDLTLHFRISAKRRSFIIKEISTI